jgi:hypothetical protein
MLDMTTAFQAQQHGCWISRCFVCDAVAFEPHTGYGTPNDYLAVEFSCTGCDGVSWVDRPARYVQGLLPPGMD